MKSVCILVSFCILFISSLSYAANKQETHTVAGKLRIGKSSIKKDNSSGLDRFKVIFNNKTIKVIDEAASVTIDKTYNNKHMTVIMMSYYTGGMDPCSSESTFIITIFTNKKYIISDEFNMCLSEDIKAVNYADYILLSWKATKTITVKVICDKTGFKFSTDKSKVKHLSNKELKDLYRLYVDVCRYGEQEVVRYNEYVLGPTCHANQDYFITYEDIIKRSNLRELCYKVISNRNNKQLKFEEFVNKFNYKL